MEAVEVVDAHSESDKEKCVVRIVEKVAYPAKDFSFRIVVLCLCICCFITAFDFIVLSSALPAIATSLDATTADAYWCSSAFVFVQAVVQLAYAAVAKALDRRICMLGALAIFTGASVLCATARSVQWLIAARTVSLNMSSSLHVGTYAQSGPFLTMEACSSRESVAAASMP
jgi:predicted MFS family arabinose efflux permease